MKGRIADRIRAARVRQEPKTAHPCATEAHYDPEQIAKLWKLDPSTVRRMFRDIPGVLKIESGNAKSRGYVTLRIPESVLQQVHRDRAK